MGKTLSFLIKGLAFLLSTGGKGDICRRDILHAIYKIVNQDSVSTTAQHCSALAILEGEHKFIEAAVLYFRDEDWVEQDEMKEDIRGKFMHVTDMVRALVTNRWEEVPKIEGAGTRPQFGAAPLSDMVPPPGSDNTEDRDYKSQYGLMYIEMLKYRRDAQAARAEATKNSRFLKKI